MISKQKAKRIAYGIVYDVVMSATLQPGPGWDGDEQSSIAHAIEKILAELKKKSQ